MTNNWELRLCCESGKVQSSDLESVVEALLKSGYEAPTEVVWCSSADGMAMLPFASIAAAARWVGNDEGLMSLTIDGYDLDISMHRRDGILVREFAGLPDQPMYDVLALTVSADFLAERWDRAVGAFREVMTRIPFVFGYLMSEVMFESVARIACIHQRIDAGRLPPFLPWLLAVPGSSPIAASMSKASQVLTRPMRIHSGVAELSLAEGIDGQPEELFRDSSNRWRSATGDEGCGYLSG